MSEVFSIKVDDDQVVRIEACSPWPGSGGLHWHEVNITTSDSSTRRYLGAIYRGFKGREFSYITSEYIDLGDLRYFVRAVTEFEEMKCRGVLEDLFNKVGEAIESFAEIRKHSPCIPRMRSLLYDIKEELKESLP